MTPPPLIPRIAPGVVVAVAVPGGAAQGRAVSVRVCRLASVPVCREVPALVVPALVDPALVDPVPAVVAVATSDDPAAGSRLTSPQPTTPRPGLPAG